MFSEIEQKAIQEKLEQLTKVKEGITSVQELSDLITKRRVTWMKEHKDELLEKYKGLPLDEVAWRIVCFDHMHIKPENSSLKAIFFK